MENVKTYSYDEASKASLNYFAGDELAARVWVNKYAMKDSYGNIYEQSPEDMHHRLANEIARIEKKYPNPMSAEEIFQLLDHFRYIIPAGSPMTGIGNNFQVASLSNCFVIGIDGDGDSYGAIMRLDEEQVQLMKRRGGVGHDLSQIRPKGTPVNNSALTSTGLVPFMERYSNSTREVAQDGRRGALMLSVSIKHPDSEAFIDAKMTEGKVTGANVSVKIDDEFMEAAVADKPYTQRFPIDSSNPLVEKKISAKKLWSKIVHNAWKSAEPGVLFWDTIIRESIPDCYADLGFRTVSTNPCGEIPLCPYDSCRLLSVNLYSYVENPFTKEAKFNFELFRSHVAKAQRIMDDIVDLELEKVDLIMSKIANDPQDDDIKHAEYHLWEKIKNKSSLGRRTGVGITAEGDMIAAMNLRYVALQFFRAHLNDVLHRVYRHLWCWLFIFLCLLLVSLRHGNHHTRATSVAIDCAAFASRTPCFYVQFVHKCLVYVVRQVHGYADGVVHPLLYCALHTHLHEPVDIVGCCFVIR
jgi:ribonucleoside-diphosphate reductase alpha chain